MKLGVLLDHLDGTPGGAEAHTAALLERTVAVGDEAVVATLSGTAPQGVTTLRVSAPRARPQRDKVFAREGERRLREVGCDVVFAIRHAPRCDVYLPHGGLVGDARAAQDRAAGGVGLLKRWGRRLGARQAFFRESEEALLGGPGGPQVIAVSSWVAARIVSRYPAAARRTTTILNGVDSAHFERASFLAEGAALRASLGLEASLVGLLLAHHPLLKGLETAVRALAEPRVRQLARPFSLLVGGGALPRSIQRLARRLGVADQLRALPARPDPRPLYAAADLLVFPTFYDPCSLVCLEALAMELPVITTPLNGVSEAMGPLAGIVLEKAGDPAALSCAIEVLADDGLRTATAVDARRVALGLPWTERLDRVLNVCRAAAAGGLGR